MADTRRISHGSPFATPEQRRKRLQGAVGGFFEGITELPLMAAEALAPDAGYTPGELRSSPKDRIRAEQFEIEEFGEWMQSDPDMARGADLGYGMSMVVDPVLDVGLAGAPLAMRGLRGLGRAVESGELAEIGTRTLASQRGAIETPTMSRGKKRFMRGAAGEEINVPKEIPVYPEVDSVPSVAQAVSKAKNMQWLKPKMVEVEKGKSPLRYKPDYAISDTDKTGPKEFFGNEKMRGGNPSFERGRRTFDFEGCGRGKFCTENEILAEACYGGDCYAAAMASRYGRDVMKTAFPPIRDQKQLGEMARAVERYGAEEAQKLYPGHIVNHYEELPKAKLAQQQKSKIQDTIDEVGVNVTVSGWHPLPETLKRLEWAREARSNGWNVILREVTADPKMFADEVDKHGISKVERYNRARDMIENTDFYVMEQPLHEGARYGEGLNLPACCKGGDCSDCGVAEGTGKEFFDFWGIEEDKPLFPDRPEWTKRRDMLAAQIGGDDYARLAGRLDNVMLQEPMKPRAFSTPQQEVKGNE